MQRPDTKSKNVKQPFSFKDNAIFDSRVFLFERTIKMTRLRIIQMPMY